MNDKLLTFAKSLGMASLPLAVLLANPKPATAGTSFQCVRNTTRGGYSTIAVRSNGVPTSPLINWNKRDFDAAGFTPERRCLTVTNRLNQVVNQNGGLLSNLWLTSGRVNNLAVICYLANGDSGCHDGNTLLTISPSSPNANNPSQALTNLINFSQTGRGSAIEETGGQKYVSLEKLVEAGGQANQNTEIPQNPTITPNPQTPTIVTPPSIQQTEPTVPAGGGGAL